MARKILHGWFSGHADHIWTPIDGYGGRRCCNIGLDQEILVGTNSQLIIDVHVCGGYSWHTNLVRLSYPLGWLE